MDYVKDESKVSYPWSMIDKITPRPDAKVQKMLEEDGFEDNYTIVTDRHTFTAPFVNAEETEYLVIEDKYTNGRPPLELGGVMYADRETVDKVEKMKVCTCLNPLHTAMSIYGCLLGYTLISAEMADEDIRGLITKMGYIEAMPVVVDPGVLKPADFIGAVLNRRLPNPFMPDAPQRIATDTSQKLSIRFGETIKAYKERGLDMDNLVLIPLVLAGYAPLHQGHRRRGQGVRAFSRSAAGRAERHRGSPGSQGRPPGLQLPEGPLHPQGCLWRRSVRGGPGRKDRGHGGRAVRRPRRRPQDPAQVRFRTLTIRPVVDPRSARPGREG